MDKENGTRSFYHLRNWENYSSSSAFYINYTESVSWAYQNITSTNVKWTVWDGGYDRYNYVSRQPFFNNEIVYQYDATDYEINFLQNLFNKLDENIELDFKKVTWDEPAHIYIWLVDQIPNFNAHGIGLFHGLKDHGNVAAIIDVTNGQNQNYTDYVIAHEVGHALGLSHPGINGHDGHYPYWDIYTTEDTVMSYNRVTNGNYGTSFTDLDLLALQSIWGSEGSYGGDDFDLNKNSSIVKKQIVSSHSIGNEYELSGITDYDGNLHGNTGSVSDDVTISYKYQGKLDVNNDSVLEAIYTNKESGRWVTASINSSTGEIDYSYHGRGGTTRVVGIYVDPLVSDGVVEQFGPFDSQQRFQTDLSTDNLTVKASGDYDGDGFQEVYWKADIGGAYLRVLMHADGNIQYSNYQSEEQMSDYLTSKGYESVISDII